MTETASHCPRRCAAHVERTAGRAPDRLVEEEPPDDDATARQQIPAESPAARLRRMVYEVYLRHGEVVLPGVVRAEVVEH